MENNIPKQCMALQGDRTKQRLGANERVNNSPLSRDRNPLARISIMFVCLLFTTMAMAITAHT